MKEHYLASNLHEAIRRDVETAQDREWRPIVTALYQWTGRFFERQMPDAELGFERMGTQEFYTCCTRCSQVFVRREVSAPGAAHKVVRCQEQSWLECPVADGAGESQHG